MSSLTGRPLVKGYFARISNGELVETLNFQFNPSEVNRSRTVDYVFESPPGSALPTALFKSMSGDSFTISLLLDAVETFNSDEEGTSAQKAFFEAFTQPDIDLFSDDLGQFVAPPSARYGMGNESWPILFTSINFRDVRWNRQGIPTRTYVDLQFRGHLTDISVLRARLDSLAALRRMVTVEGTGLG